ncbi:MAG: hypothetical protein ACKVHP_24020, partial [Verrucomicrobiales bacterium]
EGGSASDARLHQQEFGSGRVSGVEMLCWTWFLAFECWFFRQASRPIYTYGNYSQCDNLRSRSLNIVIFIIIGIHFPT